MYGKSQDVVALIKLNLIFPPVCARTLCVPLFACDKTRDCMSEGRHIRAVKNGKLGSLGTIFDGL